MLSGYLIRESVTVLLPVSKLDTGAIIVGVVVIVLIISMTINIVSV